MTLSDPVTIPQDVLARQVGEETVILDLASGRYFGLDAVGARIWQLLTEGLQPAAVRDAVVAEYEVEPQQAESDLLRLLRELQAQGLLRIG